ncbi:Retaining alpha-galactosidase [Pedobacter sp. Bi27]|uniref:glycoside hydrolase family 97 protein n=1 Tax=Pedobacter sp. Bi27 TaxID=2822351 RepID=UPI001E036E93|nr:glycoside hydrolase family 97 protein [Pedobacter sp. Bi27]CAH0314594.1 Retaining alpha-galactosidase [Pedobacter sp. Bi27]
MKQKILRLFLLTFLTIPAIAQRRLSVTSPDGRLQVGVLLTDTIGYQLFHDGKLILSANAIAMKLGNGNAFGIRSQLKQAKTTLVKEKIDAHFYKRSRINDEYSELTLDFKEDFKLIFRVYNEGMAYRFVSNGKKDFIVNEELASFRFPKDYKAYIPYVKTKEKTLEGQYFNSFENTYDYSRLSEMNSNKLAFSPLVVELDGGKKVCLAEADLQSYPGMYLYNLGGTTTLEANFAPYPKSTKQGGHNQLQQMVTSRQPFLAKSKAQTKFPWRIAIVTTTDKALADNDLVYKLAEPSRLKDVSWVKPGKVAWEWWNNWGISKVNFVTGVNNQTYKAYIDFASKNGIEYVILDEGWAVNLKASLFEVVPEINLKELVAYGKSKNVDLILWAGYYAFERDLEKVCKHYSQLGIKGFKIDFMDRDDQEMVDFHYRAAETAAKYKLLVDFHGTYKPTGLNRTFPNVINYEAVNGLEQMKWTGPEMDMVTYDVTMPFIRMVAGPVDYTQGAMRNATKRSHRGINDEPMSQGTRCRQLAEYVVFESPLNMLCDSPDNYEREQECTDFISSIPTVWDNTIVLNGEIGKYITTARKKGDTWYLGSLTNWDARKLDLDLSFLGTGDYIAEIYRDGINADKIASDYRKEQITIPANRKLSITMAQGGGFAMKIVKK